MQTADIVNILGVKITLRRFGLPVEDLKTLYTGFIRSLVKYAVPAWHPGLSEQQHSALERIHMQV